VVNLQQGQAFPADKKKHSSYHQKFFFIENLHDFDETHSLNALLAFPVLEARATRGMYFSRLRTQTYYEENRSDY
jgi:hypothetical protein